MKFSEPENRTCAKCAQTFEHFEWLRDDGKPIEGVGIDDDENLVTAPASDPAVVYCDPCIVRLNKELSAQEERKKKIAKATAKWEATVPKEYRATKRHFPGFPVELLELCLGWARGVKVSAEEHRLCLGLVGESGLCKTRVMALVAKQLLWKEKGLHWINSSQFQWCCQNQFGDNSKKAGAVLELCLKTPYLVFDDIGSLKSTETVCDNLYALLERRTAKGLPILWTSNESIDEMLAGSGITEKARKRNVSRLGGFSNIIEI